jgi:hypothetical protein
MEMWKELQEFVYKDFTEKITPTLKNSIPEISRLSYNEIKHENIKA